MNRAFKAIESVTLPAYDHLERFVIFVSAVLALGHTGFLRRKLGSAYQDGRANGYSRYFYDFSLLAVEARGLLGSSLTSGLLPHGATADFEATLLGFRP